MNEYITIYLYNDPGRGVAVEECLLCGGLTMDASKHTAWHLNLERTICDSSRRSSTGPSGQLDDPHGIDVL